MERVFSDYDVWSFKKDDRERWVWRREPPDGELLLGARTSFEGLDQWRRKCEPQWLQWRFNRSGVTCSLGAAREPINPLPLL
jgi:hypothetical protein